MTGFIRSVGRSRWFRTGFAVAVMAVLVWMFGPLLGFGATRPLETEVARWILIGALFALWLISNLLHELGQNRREKKLAESIAQEATPEQKEADARTKEATRASAEEVALLADRLAKAMAALKKSKLGGSRKRLNAMPWYMIIGPPGAGKTTALQNCGLHFPLESARTPISGVGGTRNCEWLFTDEAVLIDTAGRYTTQDSTEAVDSAAWLGFLAMLKKQRKRQPLNGMLVAISLHDLAQQTEDERRAHARAVRHRVRELHDKLGLRLPVYVLFTKADLVAGFSEFFDNLGKEEREQVWGMTFAMDDGTDDEGAVARFRTEFDLLLQRLDDRMMERVHQEPDIRRRRLIYGFPQQVASLRDVADEFLAEAFRPSRLEVRPMLRGVYMTSGTQDGMPLDRLLGTMAAEFGLPRQAVAAPSGPGRSYFLSRLLRDVVFNEAALAGLDPKVERRAKWVSIGAWAACAVVLLAASGTWLLSYIGNVELIAQVHAGAASYNAQFADLQRRGPADQDLAATVPPLNTLRDMRGGYRQRDRTPPMDVTFGLYQGSKLGQAAQDAYVNALNRILLPRLMTRVEQQLAARMNNVDFLYQTLKVYLVLARKGPLDRELVSQWVEADLLSTYPGEDQTSLRDSLQDHVDALLRQPLQPPPANDQLIAAARAILTKEPLAEYSYNRLLRSKRVLAIPDWTVAEFGGPGAGRVFQYASGKPLNTGLPGIYTWAGYHNVFLTLLPGITQDISEDAWVLGRDKRAGITGVVQDTARLRKDVLGLFYDDYARKWDAMLADIRIKPYSNTQEAMDTLSLLSAPASPLRELMLSIDAQTQLSRTGATDAAVAAAQQRAGRVGQRAAGFAAFEARSGLTIRQNELVGIFSEAFGNDPSGKPIDPARRVDEHFRALHTFVTGTESKPSGLETAILRIQAMYQGFNYAANTPGGSGVGLVTSLSGGTGPNAGPGPAAALQDLTRSMPPAVAAMLGPVARNATTLGATSAAQEMSDAWKAQVAPLCEAAFNRYPFVATSRDDVPVDDFSRLLGPGGEMEKFFDKYLKPYVDTTQKPWKFQSTVPLGLSPAALAEFERAQQIREGLFNNGTAVQVRFALKPVSLDAGIAQVSLDIGGQSMTYAHEPPQEQPFTWPGPTGKTGVRITLTPTAGGNAVMLERDGPWALLRVLDGRIAGGAQPDRFRVTLNGGIGTAVFELTASSVRNPFTLTALRSFRCPAKL